MAGEVDRTRQSDAALRGVPLFDGLPHSDLEGLAQLVVRRRYARNAVIVAHAASMALSGREGMLRVLITASPEVRIQRLTATEGRHERAATPGK